MDRCFRRTHRQSGQALTETVILLPVFVIALSALLAVVAAYGWRESGDMTATQLRLAVLPQTNTANGDAARLDVLKDLQTKSGGTMAQAERTPSRQARMTWSRQRACKPGGASAGRPKGHIGLCLQGDEQLYSSPHNNAELAPYSPVLTEILGTRAPQTSASVKPVFDNVPGYLATERGNWHRTRSSWGILRPRIMQHSQTVASGGRERPAGPYNVTRDCLFSAQGKMCVGRQARVDSDLAALLRDQRQKSAIIQATSCAAEACARAPLPVVCALQGAALALHFSTNTQPTICPLTTSAVTHAHTMAQATLRALMAKEIAEYAADKADGRLVDRAWPMY